MRKYKTFVKDFRTGMPQKEFLYNTECCRSCQNRHPLSLEITGDTIMLFHQHNGKSRLTRKGKGGSAQRALDLSKPRAPGSCLTRRTDDVSASKGIAGVSAEFNG